MSWNPILRHVTPSINSRPLDQGTNTSSTLKKSCHLRMQHPGLLHTLHQTSI